MSPMHACQNGQQRPESDNGTCDYCGVPLPPTNPRALADKRFCGDEHREAWWKLARAVGDSVLAMAAKALREKRDAA